MSIPEPLHFPKRYLTLEDKVRRLEEECYVSYVNAIRASGAIVLSADTQETYSTEEISYVEKITIQKTPTFDLVIAGAGRAQLIDGFIEYATQRVTKFQPKSIAELKATLSAALLRFYSLDVKLLPGTQKEISFIIAARQLNPPNDLELWRTSNTRVIDVPQYASVGVGKTLPNNLVRRLYRRDLPHGQMVLLSVYMVALAKSSTSVVGGETQVVFIRDNGVWTEDLDYVSVLEARAKESLAVVDDLFLVCADVGLNRTQFDEKMEEITKRITGIRKKFLTSTGDLFLEKIAKGQFPNDPYPKYPLGGSITVKEDQETGRLYTVVNDDLYEPPVWVKQAMKEQAEGRYSFLSQGSARITCKNDNCKKAFEIANSEISQAYRIEERFDHFPVELQRQILQAAGCETVADFTGKRDRKEIVLQCPHCNEKRDYGFDDFSAAPGEQA